MSTVSTRRGQECEMQFAAAESLQPAELGDISETNRRVDNQHAQRCDREMGQHSAQERERDQHSRQRGKGTQLGITTRCKASPPQRPISVPPSINIYARVLQHNLASLQMVVRQVDVVLLHDPQTAGLVAGVRELGAHVVWRCRRPY